MRWCLIAALSSCRHLTALRPRLGPAVGREPYRPTNPKTDDALDDTRSVTRVRHANASAIAGANAHLIVDYVPL
jgi:hypothetical protein